MIDITQASEMEPGNKPPIARVPTQRGIAALLAEAGELAEIVRVLSATPGLAAANASLLDSCCDLLNRVLGVAEAVTEMEARALAAQIATLEGEGKGK